MRPASPLRRAWNPVNRSRQASHHALPPSVPGSCSTPGVMTALDPAATTASAVASSWKYISQVVVTPKARSSAAASVIPQ